VNAQPPCRAGGWYFENKPFKNKLATKYQPASQSSQKKIKKKTHLTSAHTHLAALLLEAACALLGPFPAELGSSLLVSGVTLGTTLYFQKKSELHARYKTKLLDSCIFVNKELILSHKALKACKKK
jgi:hypothetical protein